MSDMAMMGCLGGAIPKYFSRVRVRPIGSSLMLPEMNKKTAILRGAPVAVCPGWCFAIRCCSFGELQMEVPPQHQFHFFNFVGIYYAKEAPSDASS